MTSLSGGWPPSRIIAGPVYNPSFLSRRCGQTKAHNAISIISAQFIPVLRKEYLGIGVLSLSFSKKNAWK